MPTIQQSGALSLHSAPHSWLELGEQCWSLSEPRCPHTPHRCQLVGRPPHVPSMPSHLGAELPLMASRCVLGPLRGRLPRGHICSPVTFIHRARCRPQCIATVPIRWHPVWDSGGHMRVVLWNKMIWDSPLPKIRWLDSQSFKGARLPWTVCAASEVRPVGLWPWPISVYVCNSFCSSFLRSMCFPAFHSKVFLVHNANSICVYYLINVTPILPLLLRLSKA